MARLAHRRIPNDGQITALVAHLFSGPHCGHALQGEHPPSSSVANGAEASPEAFDSRLPPRDVASEDGMFCPHIPKLDSSAPCFIQSRTLVQDSESSDSIAQMALQDRREDGLDRMPTQNESLTFAQTVLVIDANAELLPLWDFARRCDDHGLNTPMGSVTDLDVRTDWLHVPSVPLIADEI